MSLRIECAIAKEKSLWGFFTGKLKGSSLFFTTFGKVKKRRKNRRFQCRLAIPPPQTPADYGWLSKEGPRSWPSPPRGGRRCFVLCAGCFIMFYFFFIFCLSNFVLFCLCSGAISICFIIPFACVFCVYCMVRNMMQYVTTHNARVTQVFLKLFFLAACHTSSETRETRHQVLRSLRRAMNLCRSCMFNSSGDRSCEALQKNAMFNTRAARRVFVDVWSQRNPRSCLEQLLLATASGEPKVPVPGDQACGLGVFGFPLRPCVD